MQAVLELDGELAERLAKLSTFLGEPLARILHDAVVSYAHSEERRMELMRSLMGSDWNMGDPDPDGVDEPAQVNDHPQ